MSSNSKSSRRGVPKKRANTLTNDVTVNETINPPASPTDSGRSSLDSCCTICLGRHQNKAFANMCLHEFCFAFISEWSKVKPECPLCKQGFSSIIHNVRSNEEYDELKIPEIDPEETDLSGLDQVHYRFRYRTTVTAERRRDLALERRLRNLRQFAQDNMYGFDENADYEPRNNVQHEEVVVNESSEDEDVRGTRPPINNPQSRVAPRDITLPPSMQPGPIGIGWTSVAVMIDDGQSYTATPGHSAIRRASDEDEDVEIVQVVRPPLLPEVITLSDTEEGEEADEANSSSSRGKALKKRKGPLPVNQSPRKEQRIKSPSPAPEQSSRYSADAHQHIRPFMPPFTTTLL